MPLRSGRFSGTGSIDIVKGRQGLYRIYNTGNVSISVVASGHTAAIAVEPEQSADFETTDDISVSGAAAFEGIYDFLSPDQDIRPGKFRIAAATIGATRTIVSDADKAYRVLNSGDVKFTVHVNGALRVELGPTFSFDFVVGTKDTITIVAAEAGLLEGVYEKLNAKFEQRSGRFRFRPAPGGAAIAGYPHEIIDLSSLPSSADVRYRLFNSGDQKILIEIGRDAAHLSSFAEVAPQNSIDFRLAGGNTGKYWVRPLNAAHAIDGSFDLLEL